MGGADQLATLHFAHPGEVTPVVRTAGLAHVGHPIEVAPHDHVIVAEGTGDDAADGNIMGWDKGMPGTHGYGLAGGST
jgi:hypothetical protein